MLLESQRHLLFDGLNFPSVRVGTGASSAGAGNIPPICFYDTKPGQTSDSYLAHIVYLI